MVIECAFGRLKARWRCLNGRLDLTEDNSPVVIAACCTLHNLCESKGEMFAQVRTTEAERLDAQSEQPDARAVRGAQRAAINIRKALRNHFDNEGH